MKVTALVVNHNCEPYLDRCLDSILAQRREAGDDLEVIVADNASADGSLALAAEKARENPAVRLLELGENLGFGAANNRAAELARGEFLLLLNGDARLSGGALARLLAPLEKDRRLALAAPQLVYAEPEGRLQFSWVPPTGLAGELAQKLRNRFEDRPWAHHPRLLRLLAALLGPPWFSAACLLLRRSAFEGVGGFDPSFFLYFEDVDLCLRLRRAGWRLAFVPGARAVHVSGGSGGGRVEQEYRRSQLRYYRLHRPAWEASLLAFHLRRKYGRRLRRHRGDATARAILEMLP